MERDGKFPVRLFIVLVGVSLFLLGLDFLGASSQVKKVIEVPISPLRNAFVGIGRGTGGGIDFFRAVKKGQTRVADLERQVAELSVGALRVDSLERENEALRKLVGAGVAEDIGIDFKPFKVVGLGEEWLVAAGKKSGISKGSAVISEEGVLLGKTVSVGEFVSRVMPLGHPASSVEAMTARGVEGVVVGGVGREMKFEKVLQEKELEIGDVIVTSGTGDELPAGLMIGAVERVDEILSQVYKSAALKKIVGRVEGEFVFINIR